MVSGFENFEVISFGYYWGARAVVKTPTQSKFETSVRV